MTILLSSPQRTAISDDKRPEGSVFRVWLQRPTDTTPKTESGPAA